MDLNMARDTSEKRAIEAEHLPCPRCDSTNTKFCYYNNYNFSQPRHFCKACRRYWTHGGTLRDIPVGGATRKNAKRCRTSSSSSSSAPAYHHFPTAASQLLVGAMPFVTEGKMSGSFTSLLSSDPAAGFVSLGGFGFGLGRESWPFSAVVDGGAAAAVNGVAGQPWQLEGGGNGHYFAFPDLAISTPGSIFNK